MKTFSDSWYQISELRLALLPSVKAHKQYYRGRAWYVLQDVGGEKFYRVQPAAYRFICSLTTDTTVGEAWQQFVDTYPTEAPGQEEVIQLLVQLHHSNLLFFRSKADNVAILKRYQKHKTRENVGKLMGFLYVRIPVWNPNDFLIRWRSLLSPLFGRISFFIWAIVIFLFAKLAIENWENIWLDGQGILSLSNLPLLYVSIFVLKLFHEMAHAIVCKKYGAQVHTMGIMFIVFTPLPYIDASSSWSMRSRWHRVFVGGAGMYVELFIAALAALVWVNTGSGFLNSMAFNLMIAGSVSSLLFNGNPLLKFDAYYMLSDALDIPNLYQRAGQQWFYYVDKWLFGTPYAESAARSYSEAAWLTGYGMGSFFYRLFIMVIITFMVADIWLGLGLLMVVLMTTLWIGMPGYKLIKHLLSSKVMHNRGRAITVTLGILVVLLGGIGAYPVAYTIKAPGVVQASENVNLVIEAAGDLHSLLVRNGDPVVRGQPLMRLDNAELQRDAEILSHQVAESRLRIRQALRDGADPLPLRQQLQALEEREDELNRRLRALTMVASVSGVWVGSEDLHTRLGTMLPRGESVGRIVANRKYRFVAVVSQSQASYLFGDDISQAQVRLTGQAREIIDSQEAVFMPFHRFDLPSPALSIAGGGHLLTQTDSRGQMVTEEGFFEVIVSLPTLGQLVMFDGVTGYMRVWIGERPIGWQVYRRLRQVLQRRYQL